METLASALPYIYSSLIVVAFGIILIVQIRSGMIRENKEYRVGCKQIKHSKRIANRSSYVLHLIPIQKGVIEKLLSFLNKNRVLEVTLIKNPRSEEIAIENTIRFSTYEEGGKIEYDIIK